MSKTVTWYIGTDQRVYVLGLRKDLPLSKAVFAAAVGGSGGTITVTAEAHGLTTADTVKIGGADQSGYDGNYAVASVVDADTFTVATTGAPSGEAVPVKQRIELGQYLIDATVAGTLYDGNGVAVTGGAVTFDYKTSSYGEYVGTLPNTVSLAEGSTYSMVITATAATGEKLVMKGVGTGQYYGG